MTNKPVIQSIIDGVYQDLLINPNGGNVSINTEYSEGYQLNNNGTLKTKDITINGGTHNNVLATNPTDGSFTLNGQPLGARIYKIDELISGTFSSEDVSNSVNAYVGKNLLQRVTAIETTGSQPAFNGVGFIKANGSTISYDNSTYSLTTHTHNYLSLDGGSMNNTNMVNGLNAQYLGGIPIWNVHINRENYYSNVDANTIGSGYGLNTVGNGTGNSNFPYGYGTTINYDLGYGRTQLHFSHIGELIIRSKWGDNWCPNRTVWDSLNFNPANYLLTSNPTVFNGSWMANGGSYGFGYYGGWSMGGNGSEFSIIYKDGKGSLLTDGSHYAMEGSGFYSGVGDDFGVMKGFASDGTNCAFNAPVSAPSFSATQFISNITNSYGLIINRPSVSTFNGISYRTGSQYIWFLGMRENVSSNDYIIFNELTGTNTLTLNSSTNAATFSGDVVVGNTSTPRTVLTNNICGYGGTGTLNINPWGGSVLVSGGYGVIHSGNIGSQSVSYATNAGSAGSATYLPTCYAGGQQTNPQVYFNNTVGLKVAMTGYPYVWSDTLWINGYSGGDVKYMNALHFIRNGQPRAWISTQENTATAYGTSYELLTEYNYTSYVVPKTGGTFTGTIRLSNNEVNDVTQINHTNSRIVMSGNMHFDSFNGNQIYNQYYSNAEIQNFGHTRNNSRDITGVNTIEAVNSRAFNAFYFGSGNNYWNWQGGEIHSNTNVTTDGVLKGANVISTGNNGFHNDIYNVNVPNPIWSFGNSNQYGLAYYQGSALSVGDAIGFHFGDRTNPSFYVSANGVIFGNGSQLTHITKMWAESHPTNYYLRNNWDGQYWQLTSNHSSPVNVGHSDQSTNSDTVDGVHMWRGSLASYNALSKDANTMYIII